MIKKAIICSCKVSAGLSFVSNHNVIFFNFFSSHITSKTLDLEMYPGSPLIFYCSDGIHCQITIAYILFLFYCSALCNVYQCIYSVLSPIFSVCRFSSLCLMLNLQACVLYLNPWPVPPDQSLCKERLLYV